MLLESSSRAAGFLCFLPPLTPNHKTTLEHGRNIWDKLLRPSSKSHSQRLQTDRQTPGGVGLGRQPEWPGRNPFLGNHLVRAASAHTKAGANCKSQLTPGDNFSRRQQSLPLGGAAAPPEQLGPFEEQLPPAVQQFAVASPVTIATGSFYRLVL